MLQFSFVLIKWQLEWIIKKLSIRQERMHRTLSLQWQLRSSWQQHETIALPTKGRWSRENQKLPGAQLLLSPALSRRGRSSPALCHWTPSAQGLQPADPGPTPTPELCLGTSVGWHSQKITPDPLKDVWTEVMESWGLGCSRLGGTQPWRRARKGDGGREHWGCPKLCLRQRSIDLSYLQTFQSRVLLFAQFAGCQEGLRDRPWLLCCDTAP